jgi:hypothetical protein
MTKYRIHLAGSTVEIEAETINLGQRKLWLYDRERHLIAVFVWDKIVGVEVVGSVETQRFTEELLHEGKAADEKREAEIQNKGELWVELTDTVQQLKKVSSTLSTTWLKVYDLRRKKETEVRLLVQRHAAELRQEEAQIIDQQKELNKSLDNILKELKSLFSEGK